MYDRQERNNMFTFGGVILITMVLGAAIYGMVIRK